MSDPFFTGESERAKLGAEIAELRLLVNSLRREIADIRHKLDLPPMPRKSQVAMSTAAD
jgi:hypothetical protein